MRLLVTRPEPDGERTAERLRAHGFDVLLVPLLRVELLDGADLGEGPWSALLVTSVNAVRAAERHPRRAELTQLPVFAVGRRTAEAARAAGFGAVTSADGNLRDLAGLVRARCDAAAGPLLYLAGEDRAGDLVGDLAAAGLKVRMAVVYRAAEAPGLPAAVRAALAAGSLDGVLHFSPRSAGIFLAAAKTAGLLDRAIDLVHYCLSQQVAGPLSEAGAGRIRVASRPEEAAMIELIISSQP